jgi:heme/copper-type cytochrome/quinol oxidase subunit 2
VKRGEIMKINEILAIILVIVATVGVVLGAFAYENYRKGNVYDLELIARAPENGNWYPGKIKVSEGEEVRIQIRNIDTVTHGFTLPDFSVSIDELKAGEVKIVKFTPDKKGTFPFMCTVWCSENHLQMRGELIVE